MTHLPMMDMCPASMASLYSFRLNVHVGTADSGVGAAADAGVLVVGNLQLLGVQVMVVGALLVQAVERPDGVAAEEGMLAAAQHLVEDLVVAELAVIIHLAQRLLHLAGGGA